MKINDVLLLIHLTGTDHSTRTPTEEEAKKNNGLTADELESINDGEYDAYVIQVVNGAIQVRRVLVEDNSDEDTVDDMPYVVSDLELL